MSTAEKCICSGPMAVRRTTSLGAFLFCGHCDLPCTLGICSRCVLARSQAKP